MADMQAMTSTASRRSREAEDATTAAARASDQESHLLACELHREAAEWQKRAGRPRPSGLHEAYALVHAQLATRIRDEVPA